MKKILTIALVALLAASTAFAGISGSASVSLGYDTTSKIYGLKNGTSVEASIDLASEEVENVAEGDIYAGVKASMKLAIAPWKGPGFDDPSAMRALIWVDGGSTEYGIGLWLSLDEAYVAGEDWKLAITGTKGAPDYAKSAIDTKSKAVKDDFGNAYDTTTTAVTYKLPVWSDYGLTLTYKGYTVAGGLYGNATEDASYTNYNFFVESKALEFDGGSAQVAAIFANSADKAEDFNLGFSAKASYAVDAFSASLAGDLGLENLKDIAAKFDLAANVSYSPVALDVYFKHEGEDDNLLSAKVSGSYNDVVSGSFAFKDILEEENRNFEVEAEGTIDSVTVSGSVGMTIYTKAFTSSLSAKYVAEKFTANAGVEFGAIFGTDDSLYFATTAGVSTDVIIPGATLALTYGKDSAGNKMNFLDQANSVRKQNFGAVKASCTIEF